MLRINCKHYEYIFDNSTDKYVLDCQYNEIVSRETYERIVSDENNRFFNRAFDNGYERRYKNYTCIGYKVVKVVTCLRGYKKHVREFYFSWED